MSNNSITFQIPGQPVSQTADIVVASDQSQSASKKSDDTNLDGQAEPVKNDIEKDKHNIKSGENNSDSDVLVLLNASEQKMGKNTYGGYLSISGNDKTSSGLNKAASSEVLEGSDELAELEGQSESANSTNSSTEYVRGILDAATSAMVTSSLGDTFDLADKAKTETQLNGSAATSVDEESVESISAETANLDSFTEADSVDDSALADSTSANADSVQATEPGTDSLLVDLLNSDYADNGAVFAFLNQIAEKIDECRNGSFGSNWPTGRHFVRRRNNGGMTLADKINAESALGRNLFGAIPEGHQREFFEHRKNLWIWHESWQENDGHHEITIRYTVDSNGVFKTVNAGPYIKLEGDELVNFLKATKLYFDFIGTQLYGVAVAA